MTKTINDKFKPGFSYFDKMGSDQGLITKDDEEIWINPMIDGHEKIELSVIESTEEYSVVKITSPALFKKNKPIKSIELKMDKQELENLKTYLRQQENLSLIVS